MKRATLTLAFSLLCLAVSFRPALAGKPTVAVLGLEVFDPTGQIDQASTQVAKDLTDAMRSRAKLPSGPYQFQPGSEKELIDEKLIKNCDNEAVSCMSQIGKDLGADFLIYGRLEKKAEGYNVTINLLNVGKKKFEKAKSPLLITHAAAKDVSQLGGAATKAYNDLVGVVQNGTVVIRSNADHGTVLIDNERKGQLASGTLTLSLAEGPYRLTVEADGYDTSPEVKITVRSGETTNQQVTLMEAKGIVKKPDEMKHTITGTTSSGGGPSGVWKPLFVASVLVGLGSGGLWVYEHKQESDQARASEKAMEADAFGKSDSDCGGSVTGAHFKKACDAHKLVQLSAAGTFVSVALIAVTGYLAFGRSSSEGSAPKTATTGTVGRRERKPAFSLTPVIQANGGGAQFRIDW